MLGVSTCPRIPAAAVHDAARRKRSVAATLPTHGATTNEEHQGFTRSHFSFCLCFFTNRHTQTTPSLYNGTCVTQLLLYADVAAASADVAARGAGAAALSTRPMRKETKRQHHAAVDRPRPGAYSVSRPSCSSTSYLNEIITDMPMMPKIAVGVAHTRDA
jgi:hypothetical protein